MSESTTAAPGAQLQHERTITPWQTRSRLAIVGCFVALAELAAKSPAEREQASAWAAAVRDGGDSVEVFGRPEWLPARNTAEIGIALGLDDEQWGGEDRARQRFHDWWDEPAVETPAPARTFLDELADLDDDMARDLAAVGINLEDPKANDAPHLQVFASRLLRSAALDEAEIAQSQAAEDLEVTLIRRSYAESRGVLERRRERTVKMAREIAEFIDYGKKKSLALPFGTIGYTDYKAKAKVTDGEAAIAWAKEHLPSAVTEETIVRQTLDKSALTKHRLETGEDIAGVEVEEAHTEYFARPKLPAEVTNA